MSEGARLGALLRGVGAWVRGVGPCVRAFGVRACVRACVHSRGRALSTKKSRERSSSSRGASLRCSDVPDRPDRADRRQGQKAPAETALLGTPKNASKPGSCPCNFRSMYRRNKPRDCTVLHRTGTGPGLNCVRAVPGGYGRRLFRSWFCLPNFQN